MSEQHKEVCLLLSEPYFLTYKTTETDIVFVVTGPDIKVESKDLYDIMEVWLQATRKKTPQEQPVSIIERTHRQAREAFDL